MTTGGVRRTVIPGDKQATIDYCVLNWIKLAKDAIEKDGAFYVALSGGSTPKAIFQKLSEPQNRQILDWSKVYLFWSDERSVPPTDKESNYRMALDAGFANLPLLADHIFRMEAEGPIEESALGYERLIKKIVSKSHFHLIMVGMGEDGHTASLFPGTDGLNAPAGRLVVANWVSQKNTWRMTFTYNQLHNADHLQVYVIGPDKAVMVEKIFKVKGVEQLSSLPISALGTPSCPATWIMDRDAAARL